MYISRGSIQHSISEDFKSLISSYFKKGECDRASQKNKKELQNYITNYFDIKDPILFPYARTCLLAILKSMKLKKGSSILMTPYNIGPMVNVIESLGFKPKFVDINLEDFGPDLIDLRKKIVEKPSCFLLTYLFGNVPQMDNILNICKEYNVPIIEDISQSIGSKYKGKLLGKFGLVSFYSASLTKYVDGYNGAFILVNSKPLKSSIKEFSQSFLPPDKWRIRLIITKTLIWNIALNRFFFRFATYPFLSLLKISSRKTFEKLLGPSIKFKKNINLPSYYFEDISNIQCKTILSSFRKLNELIYRRNIYAQKAHNALKKFDIQNGSVITKSEKYKTYWQFLIKVKNTSIARNILFNHGIETGITKLPDLSEIYGVKLDNASKLKRKRIFLPLHVFLDENDYFKILKILNNQSLLI